MIRSGDRKTIGHGRHRRALWPLYGNLLITLHPDTTLYTLFGRISPPCEKSTVQRRRLIPSNPLLQGNRARPECTYDSTSASRQAPSGISSQYSLASSRWNRRTVSLSPLDIIHNHWSTSVMDTYPKMRNHVFSSNAGSCFKSESTIQIANNAIQNRIIRFIT